MSGLRVGKGSMSVDGDVDGGAAGSGWEYPSAQCVFILSIDDVEHKISKSVHIQW